MSSLIHKWGDVTIMERKQIRDVKQKIGHSLRGTYLNMWQLILCFFVCESQLLVFCEGGRKGGVLFNYQLITES